MKRNNKNNSLQNIDKRKLLCLLNSTSVCLLIFPSFHKKGVYEVIDGYVDFMVINQTHDYQYFCTLSIPRHWGTP